MHAAAEDVTCVNNYAAAEHVTARQFTVHNLLGMDSAGAVKSLA